jgi:glycine hydroxymethyltransferase
MVLVDLRPLNLTGKEAEEILDRVYITSNRNAIPYDPEKPRVTSGLRLGTPAISSRGFSINDTRKVGELIIRALKGIGEAGVEKSIQDEIVSLTNRFPVPGMD